MYTLAKTCHSELRCGVYQARKNTNSKTERSGAVQRLELIADAHSHAYEECTLGLSTLYLLEKLSTTLVILGN